MDETEWGNTFGLCNVKIEWKIEPIPSENTQKTEGMKELNPLLFDFAITPISWHINYLCWMIYTGIAPSCGWYQALQSELTKESKVQLIDTEQCFMVKQHSRCFSRFENHSLSKPFRPQVWKFTKIPSFHEHLNEPR